MTSAATTLLLRHLRRAVSRGDQTPSDAELLHRYIARRGDDDFAELVRRHAPLVLGVCRRVLHDHHEAEDALQATFLVLARKAETIRRQESLANWLYGVAHRIALRARAGAARRPAVMPQLDRPQVGDPLAEVSGRELMSLLDAELTRLPEHYRAPLLLCCLEGCTQDEAARRLGWSDGTLRGRVERGRELLRARLARRGLTLTMVLGAAALIGGSSDAAAASCAGASARAVALAEGWLRALLLRRLRSAAVLLLGLLGVVAGVASLTPAQVPPQASAPTPFPMPEAIREDLDEPLPEGAIARHGTARLRHGQAVRFVGFVGGGKKLVSAGDDGVRIWDACTGRAVHRFADSPANSHLPFAALSPTDGLMALGGGDGEFRLWAVPEGKLVRAIAQEPAYKGVVFSPDGKRFAAFTDQGRIDIRDAATGARSDPAMRHEGRLWCVAFAPDGKALFTGGTDKVIRLWDVATAKVLRTIDGSPHIVGSLTPSPDGRLLATVGQREVNLAPQTTAWLADNRVLLWDVSSGKELRQLAMASERKNHGIPEGFTGVAFAPDGKTLATAGLDGFVRFWDPLTGRELRQVSGACNGLAALAFSPDGRALAVASGSAVRLLDVAKGQNLLGNPGHERHVYVATVLADGRTVATTGDESIRLWDLTTGRLRRALPGLERGGMDLVASRDGRTLYSLSNDASLRAWDVDRGRERRRFSPDDHSIYGSGLLALSPDGTLLAEGGHKGIRLFDPATGVEKRKLVGIDQSVYGVQFLQGGRSLVAWTADQVVHFWDVASGRKLRHFPINGDPLSPDGLPSFMARVSPDERTFLFASQNRFLTLHDLATGRVIRRYDNLPDGACPLAFSPDGHCLAWSGWGSDLSVHLLELATGQDRRRFVGHTGRVLAMTFAPDGRTLVSGGEDTTALVWDVAGRLAKAEPPTNQDFEAVASPDAARADIAVRRLAAAPGQAIPRLTKSLVPVAAVDEKRLRQFIADLDANEFATREAASASLEKLGEVAGAACRKALDDNPSAEQRRRLERILEGCSPWAQETPECLRTLRSLEVLERAGTEEARRTLEALAKGAAGAWQTEQARAALQRLR